MLPGANVIAVEIHQASATSSDISFDLETLLYTNETLPVLGCICSDETVTLTWSKWASGWQLQESADLLIWDDVLITPADSDSGISLTLPRSPGGAYYRIVAP